MDQKRKWLIVEAVVIFLVGIFLASYLASVLHLLLTGDLSKDSFFNLGVIQCWLNIKDVSVIRNLFLLMVAIFGLIAISLPFTMVKEIKSELIKIT